jgi:hypothetical protein
MLIVWVDMQVHEAFPDAWHGRAKVYVMPKLWYLRVGVLEAQDVLPPDHLGDKGQRHPEVFAKVQVGGTVLRTRPCATRSMTWNEVMVFAVSDPFDEPVVLIVDVRVHPSGKNEIVGPAHPLLALHPSGLCRNDELRLIVRLTCLSLGNVLRLYDQPLLPAMHYLQPFNVPLREA